MMNQLPTEMLLKIHRRLSPPALKKAVLVDKRWRYLGEDPTLWDWCKVEVCTKEDIDNLSIRRLKNITEVLISPDKWDTDNWVAFFRAVEKLSSLKKIDGFEWQPNGLNLVDSGLLARSWAKMEDVSVNAVCVNGHLDYDHIRALFTEMASTTRVKKFHLVAFDLSQMETELFVRALSRVEDLSIDFLNITEDQLLALLTEASHNRSLKRLVLQGNFCYRMWPLLEPGFFATAISTIEEVSLTDFSANSSYHMEALFVKLKVGTQLRRLSLIDIDLSEFGSALLAEALSGLEELRLESNNISTGQIQALFAQMSLRTPMKKIVLRWINLSQLDQELFVRVMARLEHLRLTDCNITANQVLQLFTEMSSNSHLKSLDISGTDLSPVAPEVLSKVLSRLESVTSLETVDVMTSDQAVALLSEMSGNTVMKKFGLDWVDLSSVNTNILASALVRLEEVRLDGNGITHDQAMALCREMSQHSQLKKLDLNEGAFTSVYPEVLAAAVTNVKEVTFEKVYLSPEQITSIFTHVLKDDIKLRKLTLWDRGATDDVDPELVGKVKEKLKSRLIIYEEDIDSDEGGDEDDDDYADDLSSSGMGSATASISEEEVEELGENDEDAGDNEEAVNGNDVAAEEN